MLLHAFHQPWESPVVLSITVTRSPGTRLSIFLSDWAGQNSYWASTMDSSPIENLRYVSKPLKLSFREFRLYQVTNSTTRKKIYANKKPWLDFFGKQWISILAIIYAVLTWSKFSSIREKILSIGNVFIACRLRWCYCCTYFHMLNVLIGFQAQCKANFFAVGI